MLCLALAVALAAPPPPGDPTLGAMLLADPAPVPAGTPPWTLRWLAASVDAAAPPDADTPPGFTWFDGTTGTPADFDAAREECRRTLVRLRTCPPLSDRRLLPPRADVQARLAANREYRERLEADLRFDPRSPRLRAFLAAARDVYAVLDLADDCLLFTGPATTRLRLGALRDALGDAYPVLPGPYPDWLFEDVTDYPRRR